MVCASAAVVVLVSLLSAPLGSVVYMLVFSPPHVAPIFTPGGPVYCKVQSKSIYAKSSISSRA